MNLNPYSEHEDEIILMIMENRGKLAQRPALDANLHLLPGRTREGALYRYFSLKNKAELEEKRKQKKENAKDHPPGSRPMVMESWTDEEDALLWNSVQTRPPGKGIHAELKDVHKLLPERTFSSVLNHYYALKKRFAAEDAAASQPPAPEKPPETPPQPPENPPAPMTPAFTYNTLNGTTNTTGTYNTVTYAPRPTWQPPVEQIVIPAAPAPKPPETPLPPLEEPPAPRLADRAEEFIESLYSVVKENKDLRKQVEQLQQERANSLGKMETDLQAERNVTARLRKQIATLEEDRDSFLRLMDKARTIGREESGIK